MASGGRMHSAVGPGGEAHDRQQAWVCLGSGMVRTPTVGPLSRLACQVLVLNCLPLRCCCSTACQRETHPPSCRVFCRPALREVCYRGIRALPQCNDSLSTKLVWYSEVRAAEPSLYASPAQVSPSTVRCSSLRCPHTRTSSPPLAVPHHQPRSSLRRQLMEEGTWRTGTKK